VKHSLAVREEYKLIALDDKNPRNILGFYREEMQDSGESCIMRNHYISTLFMIIFRRENQRGRVM
jgi:hypothetical protein